MAGFSFNIYGVLRVLFTSQSIDLILSRDPHCRVALITN